jgi:hypothetical protein
MPCPNDPDQTDAELRTYHVCGQCHGGWCEEHRESYDICACGEEPEPAEVFTRGQILAAVQQGIAQGLLIAVADDGTGREVAAAQDCGREIVLTMEGFDDAMAATGDASEG